MSVFVITVLSIYLVINLYIALRAGSVFPRGGFRRLLLGLIVVVAAAAYPLAQLGRPILPGPVYLGLIWIGSWWIGFMFYLFLFLLLSDLIGVLDRCFHFLPRTFRTNPLRTRRVVLLVVFILVFIIMVTGHLNARYPRVETVEIQLPPGGGSLEKLNLVFISDLHLGRMVGRSHLRRVVRAINALEPDLVLLGGDILDGNVPREEKAALQELVPGLRSRWGVYAVTGNHEYIGGVEEAVEALSRAGITVLRDQKIKLAGSFYLAGREDLSRRRYRGGTKTLAELLKGGDWRCPVILLDHQPARIEEAVKNGVAVLLCGHTHAGQLFPFHWFVKLFYPHIQGYFRKGNTHVYVTAGVGTWGPPSRVGNVPEIVQLLITFGE